MVRFKNVRNAMIQNKIFTAGQSFEPGGAVLKT